jgi:hypothetical protein
MKKRLPVFHLFGEITRRDDEARTVEGYVFVNEVVGDGFRIRRSAMEEATEAYWRNLREMHGASAAGTAKEIVWDEKGCFCRFHVVDDAAWDKVVSGVYRGFSIGVKPLVARGSNPVDVTRVDWIETSLVDRPRDRDALIGQIHRVDGSPEWDAEVDVEFDTPPIQRGLFADAVESRMPSMQIEFAFDLLRGVTYDLCYEKPENADALLRKAAAEFAEFVSPLVGRVDGSEITRRREGEPAPIHPSPLPPSMPDTMLSRLDALESAMQRWVERPDPVQERPMLVTARGLVERMGATPTIADERSSIRQQIDDLVNGSYATEAERSEAFLKLNALKAQLG